MLLQKLIAQTALPVLSLYNRWCEDMPGRHSVARAENLHIEVPNRDFGFQWYSQGFYVAAPFARALGEHHMMNLNRFGWDMLVNFFLINHNLDVGYTFPSMLQHRGVVSSGLWGQHASSCYLEDVDRR